MLRFEGLCAGYDGVERMHDITCRFERGKMTALIGPNGSGKSTMIQCAAGILKPMRGRIMLEEKPYSEFSAKEMARRISYMPQNRIAPSITVRQLVSHGRYPHLSWGRSMSEEDRAIVREAMIRTGTRDFADRTVSQLSGGERQKVYLAMLLSQQAPVMLLDEPTGALDLGAQFELMSLLGDLRDDGRTIIIVLHDLALALEYADELMLIQDGRLVKSGSAEDVAGSIGDAFRVQTERTPSGKYVFSPIEGE